MKRQLIQKVKSLGMCNFKIFLMLITTYLCCIKKIVLHKLLTTLRYDQKTKNKQTNKQKTKTTKGSLLVVFLQTVGILKQISYAFPMV